MIMIIIYNYSNYNCLIFTIIYNYSNYYNYNYIYYYLQLL